MVEASSDKRIFVWRGEGVLRNYTSGMAVVVASDEAAAWDRLKQEDFHVWFWLRTGVSHVYSAAEAEIIEAEDHVPGFPRQPAAYDLNDLPVLIKEGGG